MKSFHFRFRQKKTRGGFNLVEATLSLGVMSAGVLTLVPLLAVGSKTARLGRNEQTMAQIAQTQVEEARQGTLLAGVTSLDVEGNPCASTQAAFTSQATLTPVAGSSSLTQVTLQVTPLGAPDRARIYAVVVAPAP